MNILGYGKKKGRKTQHLKDLRNKHHKNQHLQNAWNKYGQENFNFIIVENMPNTTEQELLDMEQKYLDIAKLEKDKCYNKSFVAGRPEMTEEVKRKLSASAKINFKGIGNPMFGKHHSEESKKMMSMIGKERLRTQKHPRLGKKHSEETIIKMKQNSNKEKQKTPVKQITKDGITIKIWDSISNASRCLFGKKTSQISRVCNGYEKICKGFIWQHATKEEYEQFKKENPHLYIPGGDL